MRDEIYVRPFAGSIEFEVPLEAPTVCTKFRPKAAYFRDGGPTAANSTTSDRRDFSIARSPKGVLGGGYSSANPQIRSTSSNRDS